MAGTKAGGERAAATNKELYGDDWYKRIGAIGGQKGRTGGFFANRELAAEAGRKGGAKSKRNSSLVAQLQQMQVGQSIPFNEPTEVIRNRYYKAARRVGIQISVIVSGEGCRLIRRS
jgi:general stress protein YciG